MTLGGTADIREGIEEGDPVKVIMGTLQTASMLRNEIVVTIPALRL